MKNGLLLKNKPITPIGENDNKTYGYKPDAHLAQFVNQMTKAKQYHLNFKVVSLNNERKVPYIETDNDSSGYSINSEIAEFLNGLGAEGVDSIIDRINDLQSFTSPPYDNTIEGSYEELVEIYFQPSRVIFNRGGLDVVVPLQDFIDILNEWKDYLNSLPFRHALSDR